MPPKGASKKPPRGHSQNGSTKQNEPVSATHEKQPKTRKRKREDGTDDAFKASKATTSNPPRVTRSKAGQDQATPPVTADGHSSMTTDSRASIAAPSPSVENSKNASQAPAKPIKLTLKPPAKPPQDSGPAHDSGPPQSSEPSKKRASTKKRKVIQDEDDGSISTLFKAPKERKRQRKHKTDHERDDGSVSTKLAQPKQSETTRDDEHGIDENNEVEAPKSWAAYNAKYKDLEKGELEHGRKKRARHLTWAVWHAESKQQKSFIFFYGQDERYGGPFEFLSNFYPSKFMDRRMLQNHEFVSVEQYYQYSKCEIMALAQKLTMQGTNSRDVRWLILCEENPNKIAKLGRLFCLKNSPRATDRKWFEDWNELWRLGVAEVLLRAVRFKFEQNEDLATLLLMTGDFELVEASRRDDQCGIGMTAAQAIAQGPSKWQFPGRNWLGQMLMEIREELRSKFPEYPKFYALKYFQAYEDYLQWRRKTSRTEAHCAKRKRDLALLIEEWKQSGGLSTKLYAGTPRFEDGTDGPDVEVTDLTDLSQDMSGLQTGESSAAKRKQEQPQADAGSSSQPPSGSIDDPMDDKPMSGGDLFSAGWPDADFGGVELDGTKHPDEDDEDDEEDDTEFLQNFELARTEYKKKKAAKTNTIEDDLAQIKREAEAKARATRREAAKKSHRE